MRRSHSYGFRSLLSLAQMHERLERTGPWRWIAPAELGPRSEMPTRNVSEVDGGLVTIVEHYNQYFDVRLELESLADDHDTRFERVDAIVRERLLPAIDATAVRSGGPTYDRRSVEAYELHCSLTLAEIRDRFRELGRWQWIDRDNDTYGEYISAGLMPAPDSGIAKIFVEDGYFVINIKLESYQRDADARFAIVRAQIFDELLPAIGARVIGETDTYE